MNLYLEKGLPQIAYSLWRRSFGTRGAAIDAEGVVVRHARMRCVDDERKVWSFSIPTY
jgi:hypothetical protein